MWLTANRMAELFQRDEKTIRKHINNVFADGELLKDINTHFLRVDGVKQPVAFYTLDVILRRIPREEQARRAVPAVGQQSVEGVSCERTCRQRAVAP